jgi:hypothetical protein
MPTMYLYDLRKDYPGLDDREIASKIANKNGYSVIVRYKHPNSSEYDHLGCCSNESQAAGYLNNQYCKDPEIIYSSATSQCSICGHEFSRTPADSRTLLGELLLQNGWHCIQCGKRFCINCAPKDPSGTLVCSCGESLLPHGM